MGCALKQLLENEHHEEEQQAEERKAAWGPPNDAPKMWGGRRGSWGVPLPAARGRAGPGRAGPPQLRRVSNPAAVGTGGLVGFAERGPGGRAPQLEVHAAGLQRAYAPCDEGELRDALLEGEVQFVDLPARLDHVDGRALGLGDFAEGVRTLDFFGALFTHVLYWYGWGELALSKRRRGIPAGTSLDSCLALKQGLLAILDELRETGRGDVCIFGT
eukprot:gene43274-20282_t